MFTYHSTKVLPYVYMCVDPNTGRFYIGYRHANYVPSTQDLGVHYFTSNDYVKENFNQFNSYIVAEFFNKEDAYKFESELIRATKNANQINADRIYKIFGTITTICRYPGCTKFVKNWRTKFCSPSHCGKFAAKSRHKTLN